MQSADADAEGRGQVWDIRESLRTRRIGRTGRAAATRASVGLAEPALRERGERKRHVHRRETTYFYIPMSAYFVYMFT